MEKLRFKILVDLIPEMRDMDIDDIRRGIEVDIPDLFGDHGPGDDLSRVPHEEFKQGIFFRREFDLCLLPKNPMPIGLQNEVRDLKSRGENLPPSLF